MMNLRRVFSAFLSVVLIAASSCASALSGIDYSRIRKQALVYPVKLNIGELTFQGTLSRMDKLTDEEFYKVIADAIKGEGFTELELAEAMATVDRVAKAEVLTQEDIDRVMGNLMKLAGVDNIADLIKAVAGPDGDAFADSLQGLAADEAKDKALEWVFEQAAEGAGEAAGIATKLLDAAIISADQHERDKKKWKDRVDAANAERRLQAFYERVNDLIDGLTGMRSHGWALNIVDSDREQFTFFTTAGNLEIWTINMILKKHDIGENTGPSGKYSGTVTFTVEYDMSPFDEGFEDWIINKTGMIKGMKEHFSGSAAVSVGISGSDITYAPDAYDPTNIRRTLDSADYTATLTAPASKGQRVRSRLDFAGLTDIKEISLRHELVFTIKTSGRVKYSTTHTVEFTAENEETLHRRITDKTTISAGGRTSSGTSDTSQEQAWDPAIWAQWDKDKWLEITYP